MLIKEKKKNEAWLPSLEHESLTGGQTFAVASTTCLSSTSVGRR